MAIPYVTLPTAPVPALADDQTDLMRRYCPTLALYTHEQLATYITPDEQGCWSWPGRRSTDGYGEVSTAEGWDTSRSIGVHRYMYTLLVGPIPEGHYVHHRCENPPCWHPLHLQALTPKEHHAVHHPPPPPWQPPVQLVLAFAR